MQPNYKTERLFLRMLSNYDAGFILELVNSAGWIKFIGDRHIKTIEEAENYVQKINTNPAIHYRVVTLLDTKTAIGVVTLIKRDYLDHPDIGFAFLPAFCKQGYAFEAAKAVLKDLLNIDTQLTVLATTVTENSSSIQLLKKMGFLFSKEITIHGELLQVFAIQKNNSNSNI
jgi:RimJ/RimL family protein N-acetyltransferase